MKPNVLLQLPEEQASRIFAHNSGQKRVNELLRTATNMRISRNTIATVAQQDDFMKRVRANGGARSTLRDEGILILGGDYAAQVAVARALGVVVPDQGEIVSIRVGPIDFAAANSIELDGRRWHTINHEDESNLPAPLIMGQ